MCKEGREVRGGRASTAAPQLVPLSSASHLAASSLDLSSCPPSSDASFAIVVAVGLLGGCHRGSTLSTLLAHPEGVVELHRHGTEPHHGLVFETAKRVNKNNKLKKGWRRETKKKLYSTVNIGSLEALLVW